MLLVHVIILLIFIQILGIARVLNLELFILIINSVVILYYLFLNKNKIVIELNKVKVTIFLSVFYIFYLCLGYIKSDHMTFIIISINITHALLVLFFIFVVYKRYKQYIMNYFLGSSLLLSIIAIVTYLITYKQQSIELAVPRANALLGNPNTLGITILILSLVIFNKSKIILFDYLVIMINLTAIILTVSRSTILILCTIITIVFLKSKLETRKKLLISIFGVGIMLLTYKAINSFNDSFFKNRFNFTDDDFDNGRIEALVIGLKNFYNGFFGVGIGNTTNGGVQAAHNFYIEIIAQSGILMGPFIIIIFCYFFYLIIKSLKLNNYFLVSSSLLLFMYPFFSHRIHYMLVIILIFGVMISEMVKSNSEVDELQFPPKN